MTMTLWRVALSLLLASSSHAVILTVDSVLDHQDALPGDGVCASPSGVCTLRAAIEETNALSGSNEIHFAIPGNGRHTIVPTDLLPRMTSQLTIDGLTQSGSVAGDPAQDISHNLNVEIDGSAIGYCLWFEADNAVLRGIRTVNCTSPSGGYGVYFSHANFLVEYSEFINGKLGIQWDQDGVMWRNLVQGTIVDGLHSFDAINVQIIENAILDTREDGIFIDNCTNCFIARNWISRNGVQNESGVWSGIALRHGEGYVIQSNHIGTDHLGMVAQPNHWGIRLEGMMDDVLIGGPNSGEGNIISGNDFLAIYVGPTVASVRVEGDTIGFAADGTTLLLNNGGVEQVLDDGPSTTFVNNLIYVYVPPVPGCCGVAGAEGEGTCLDANITQGGTVSLEACNEILAIYAPPGASATHFSPGASCTDTGQGPILGTCPTVGCSQSPSTDCQVSNGRSPLRLTSSTPVRLRAKGSKFDNTDLLSFGDPTTVTGYAVCLYEDEQLIFQDVVDPGSSWKAVNKGFRHRDAGTTINRLALKSTNGLGRVVVKGKGGDLDLIPPPAGALLLQVQNSRARCWEIAD